LCMEFLLQRGDVEGLHAFAFLYAGSSERVRRQL
jgi:hypothetical protein